MRSFFSLQINITIMIFDDTAITNDKILANDRGQINVQ